MALLLLEECICPIEFFEEDFGKENAIKRRNDGNPNVDEAVGDLSTGRRTMEGTKLDEESRFDAGVVQNTDTRATG